MKQVKFITVTIVFLNINTDWSLNITYLKKKLIEDTIFINLNLP